MVLVVANVVNGKQCQITLDAQMLKLSRFFLSLFRERKSKKTRANFSSFRFVTVQKVNVLYRK